MTELRKKILKNIKKIVIKVGTSVLTDEHNRLDSVKIASIVSQVCSLKHKGIEVILVSSGAIGAGMAVLGLKMRPFDISRQQAAAAIGQIQLMKAYDDFFKAKGAVAAQVLLTQDDFSDRKRYLNAKNTLFAILTSGAVPVINENDTVAVDEIKFGDNDRLSSLVCNMAGAQLLFILSDVDGLLRQKETLSIIEKITPDIERLAKGTAKEVSLGGMVTKLGAVKAATAAGAVCIIANGRVPDIITKTLEFENVGTMFLPRPEKMSSKKSWIAFTLKTKGRISVDKGAHQAITVGGKSLLASGVTAVTGTFQKGDVVSIAADNRVDFAKGISGYSADQLDKIKGLKTHQAEALLGHKICEVVHRDNLVVFH